jgi:hypothetical protein
LSQLEVALSLLIFWNCQVKQNAPRSGTPRGRRLSLSEAQHLWSNFALNDSGF